MSRKLSFAAVVLSCVLALSAGVSALAQQAAPGRARLERPQPANLQVAPAPPALQQLLQNWSNASAKIQKLQGKHQRHVFDHTFQSEKRASGVFYYEAPDKGRIDLKPVAIGARDVSVKKDPRNGAPYTLKPDKEERWICNGTEIMQINDADKSVEIIPIPAEGQGANIMDGPLPFLFGMPPEKALRRYEMKIVQENAEKALLEIKPQWKQDAANWREAQVILSKTTYLPEAVKLIDPSGNLETWYQFEDLQPNKRELFGLVKDWIGKGDPFNPPLLGYRKNILQAAAAVEEQPPQAILPAVANFPLKEAKAVLERIGCEVEIKAGTPAPRGPLAMVVYEQNPPGRAPYQRGMKVTLTVHTPNGQMPDLSGYYWKDVKAVFEGATPAYQLTWKQGPAANEPAQQYTIMNQRPQPGEPLQPGQGVALLVSTAPQPPAAASGDAAERR